MTDREVPIDADMPAQLRHERIAELIGEQGFVRVTDLAMRFGVSAVTIRSDLQVLEAHGRLHRIRGGAVPFTAIPSEQPFEAAERALAPEKARIGRHAAQLVAPGETVLLDVGTTTTAVARALTARPELTEVTVLTNALNIAVELEAAYPRITVVVTGGTVRPLQHSLVNPLATRLLSEIHGSICFLGCNGIDARRGVTNVNLPEAEVKRAMLLAARRRVIVADGSKFGEIELAKVCDTHEVSTVITDPSADPTVIAEIENTGCEVIVVDAP